MAETLPPRTVTLPRGMTSKAIGEINRDARSIERLALALAMNALRYVEDLPAAELGEALYLNAEALRRAAEIVDERATLISNGGKIGSTEGK